MILKNKDRNNRRSIRYLRKIFHFTKNRWKNLRANIMNKTKIRIDKASKITQK